MITEWPALISPLLSPTRPDQIDPKPNHPPFNSKRGDKTTPPEEPVTMETLEHAMIAPRLRIAVMFPFSEHTNHFH